MRCPTAAATRRYGIPLGAASGAAGANAERSGRFGSCLPRVALLIQLSDSPIEQGAIHLDLRPEDQSACVDQALKLGATRRHQAVRRRGCHGRPPRQPLLRYPGSGRLPSLPGQRPGNRNVDRLGVRGVPDLLLSWFRSVFAATATSLHAKKSTSGQGSA